MTKVQADSNGKIILLQGKALEATDKGLLERIMSDIVSGNNPVDITELQQVETQIQNFLNI